MYLKENHNELVVKQEDRAFPSGDDIDGWFGVARVGLGLDVFDTEGAVNVSHHPNGYVQRHASVLCRRGRGLCRYVEGAAEPHEALPGCHL